MLTPVSDDLYSLFAVFTERVLTKARVGLERFPTEVAKYSHFIQMLQLLQSHKNDLSHLGGEKFLSRRLDETVYLGPSHFSVYKPFFDDESEIQFFKLGKQVFAEAKNYRFALPFPHGVEQLNLVYTRDWYGECDVHDGYVIDVGAFIGETAVYFVSKGARKVLAFEAAPPLFRLAKQNIVLNHVENVVQIKNAAVSDRNGSIRFDYLSNQPASSSYLNSSAQGATTFVIKSISLKDVIGHSDHVDLLKLNCEGAEHQILRQAHELNLFDNIGSIMVEVHGPDEKLRGYLKNASYKIVSYRPTTKGICNIYATRN
jgi:FkbM family methyltransferase